MLDVLAQVPAGAGPIGLLSSDEFTPAVAAFDRALLAAARGPAVAIVPAADPAHAEAIGAAARAHLIPLGATLVDDPAAADVIYLPGGDPRVLLETIRWPPIEEAWRAGAALVGSSAGAMALCEYCLIPRPGDDKPTMWTQGVGPLRGVGLAVHAATRPRSWLRAVTEISHSPVVAIDDATGVLLAHGEEPDIIGAGRAWVVADRS